MTQENQKKIDGINDRINSLQESISKCYNNNERARLDCEIKKCRKEIEEIKRSEMKQPEAKLRIDDPTFLDRKTKQRVTSGSISKVGGRDFSVII